jgi:hypothetical protein
MERICTLATKARQGNVVYTQENRATLGASIDQLSIVDGQCIGTTALRGCFFCGGQFSFSNGNFSRCQGISASTLNVDGVCIYWTYMTGPPKSTCQYVTFYRNEGHLHVYCNRLGYEATLIYGCSFVSGRMNMTFYGNYQSSVRVEKCTFKNNEILVTVFRAATAQSYRIFDCVIDNDFVPVRSNTVVQFNYVTATRSHVGFALSICSTVVGSCYPLYICPTTPFTASNAFAPSPTVTFYGRAHRHYNPSGSYDLDGVSNPNLGDTVAFTDTTVAALSFNITDCTFYGFINACAITFALAPYGVPSRIEDCRFAEIDNTGGEGACANLDVRNVIMERICTLTTKAYRGNVMCTAVNRPVDAMSIDEMSIVGGECLGGTATLRGAFFCGCKFSFSNGNFSRCIGISVGGANVDGVCIYWNDLNLVPPHQHSM